MSSETRTTSRPSRILLVVAAPAEVRAVLAGLGESSTTAQEPWRALPRGPLFDVVETGVGKGCAAGAVGRCFDVGRHRAVVNLGVAGALPGSSLALKDVLLATQSVYADEGVLTPPGFVDVAAMGFAPGPDAGAISASTDPELFERLRPIATRFGPMATVSTCSGTDAAAAEVVRRTSAMGEAMEGAAAAFACGRAAWLTRSRAPFVEIRVISNTTGDRPRQQWDLAGALRRLGEVAGVLPSLLA